jgi:hypothetical protein
MAVTTCNGSVYLGRIEREEWMPTRTIAERTARVPTAVIAMKSITTCSMPRVCRMERITAAVMMAGLGIDIAGFLL